MDRVGLVVEGGRRAGKIVDLIDFDIKGEADVMSHELKMGVIEEMVDIFARAGEEIIDAKDLMPLLQEALAQMGTEESSPTRNKNSLSF